MKTATSRVVQTAIGVRKLTTTGFVTTVGAAITESSVVVVEITAERNVVMDARLSLLAATKHCAMRGVCKNTR